jgi:hypothetical protein
MPLRLSDLRSASSNFVRKYAAEGLTESRASQLGYKTAFLCHSHKDAEYVKGFIAQVKDQGWKIYVDWQDHTMPERPNAETADRIQAVIKRLNLFLFLATPNSTASKWCPWEIGYADGVKDRNKILIIQTQDDQGNIYGVEYLDLYQKIDRSLAGTLEASGPRATFSRPVQLL